MATLQDLEQAIDAMIQHPLGVGHYQLVRRVEEKAYEAYVFALCLRAARELGGNPVLCGISGPPTPFVFRGAPGQIHSTYRNYGYARFQLGGSEFEIHAGVEFKGTSEMTHELDVAIMRFADAEKCRDEPADPASSSLIAGWECKFYVGNLDKSLGRQLVGLVNDLGSNIRVEGLCSNVQSQQLRLYLKGRERPHPHFQLTPLNPANEVIFVNLLKAELRKMTAT